MAISSLDGGGAQRVAVNMANHWVARGDEVALLTLFQGGRPPAYRLDPRVRHRDLRHVTGPASAAIDALIGACDRASAAVLRDDLPRLSAIREALAAARPDAIVSHIHITNVRMIAASWGTGVPLFACEHSNPLDDDIRGWKPARRALYRHATVVGLSEEDVAWFRRWGLDPVVVPNPVLRPLRVDPTPREGRTLITHCRLDAQKGLDLLLPAFAAIAPSHPEWTLVIHGEGPERTRLERLVRELGLGDRVAMAGFTDDVDAALRQADLFVLPSRFEAFPNSLCEAMANGLPAVAFDCGEAVRTIVRDGVDGVLVPAGDIAALGRALSRLMDDGALRHRMAARAREVAERFSIESVAARWDELLGAGVPAC